MATDDQPADAEAERPRGLRAGTVALVAVLLAVGLVAGLGLIIRRILADGGGRAAVAVEQAGPGAGGAAEASQKVLERVTEHGIELRVHVTDDAGLFGGGGDREGRPAWCEVTGMLQATAVAPDAVATTQVPLTREAPPDGNLAIMAGGMLEGAPMWGILAQVGADVVAVNARGSNGASDAMEPVGGVAVLALPAPDDLQQLLNGFGGQGRVGPDELTVQLLRADGSTTFVGMDELMQGPALWVDPQCQDVLDEAVVAPAPDLSTPPGSLPPGTGRQPPDPAAAREHIVAAMHAVYAAGAANDAARVARIDDPGGVQYALAGLRARDGEPDVGDVEVRDLVFLTEAEASFFYLITLNGAPHPMQFGRARLIDGVWKITRATYCQDLAKLGWDCGP
jgi:hypothetical protein